MPVCNHTHMCFGPDQPQNWSDFPKNGCCVERVVVEGFLCCDGERRAAFPPPSTLSWPQWKSPHPRVQRARRAVPRVWVRCARSTAAVEDHGRAQRETRARHGCCLVAADVPRPHHGTRPRRRREVVRALPRTVDRHASPAAATCACRHCVWTRRKRDVPHGTVVANAGIHYPSHAVGRAAATAAPPRTPRSPGTTGARSRRPERAGPALVVAEDAVVRHLRHPPARRLSRAVRLRRAVRPAAGGHGGARRAGDTADLWSLFIM